MNELFIDDLRNSTESYSVALRDFYSKFESDNELLFSFFEGKEDRYYYNIRIKFFSKKHKYFVCGGKGEVIKIFNILSKHKIYGKSKIGYYVDLDFDPSINVDQIYETPYYSVENFYIQKAAVEEILDEVFDMKQDDIKKCINLYTKLLKDFNSKFLFLNAWLACHSDLRIKGKKNRLNIEEITSSLFKNLIDNLKIKDIPEIETLSSIEKLFNNNDISRKRFYTKVNKFRQVDHTKVFRGKFSIKFLLFFLNELKKSLEKKNNTICSKKYICQLHFNNKSLLLQLTSYAITPESLEEYIRRIA